MVKDFFAGLEEVASRLLSLVFTIVFFLIYILARSNQEMTVNWYKMFVILGLFWLVYETLGYVLFSIFKYFGKQKPPEEIKDLPTTPTFTE